MVTHEDIEPGRITVKNILGILYRADRKGKDGLITWDIASKIWPYSCSGYKVIMVSRILGYLKGTNRVEKNGRAEFDKRKTIWRITKNGKSFYEAAHL